MRAAWIWIDRLLLPVLFGLLIALSLSKERSGGRASLIWSDAEGYYLYLPATIIYGDWQTWDGFDGIQMLSCCAISETGIVKTRYTYGVAAMQLPFFWVAHVATDAFRGRGTPPPYDYGLQYPDQSTQSLHQRKYTEFRGQATGFSDNYGIGLSVAAAFYTTLGLWFVRQRLRKHLSAPVATLTTLLVLGATNLYYYTVIEGGMSHAYSFCLFAAFAWLLHLWMARPRWALSLGLGACLALIFLIRPTNIVVALLLLLWEVYAWQDARARFAQLLAHWPHLLAMAGMAVLFVVPQLYYWHYAFGDWVVWSYEGEGFSNALHPKVLQVLFSYQNGLFLYTPIMLLAVVGMVVGWRRRQHSAPVTLLIFALATYVFASWWAWWFGGAFGHRCYVEYYALLALPLGTVVAWLWENQRLWLKWAGMALLLGFIVVNLRLTASYAPPWDGPGWTMDSYIAVMKHALLFWK